MPKTTTTRKRAAPLAVPAPKRRKRRVRTTKPAHVEAQIRKAEALKLRRAGHQYDEIAEKLQVSPSTACRYVNDALSELAEKCADRAGNVRQMELRRLDAVFKKMFELAEKGSPKAAAVCAKIIAQRCKLLGLDKVAVDVNINVKGYAVAAASPDAFPPPPKEGEPQATSPPAIDPEAPAAPAPEQPRDLQTAFPPPPEAAS